MIFIGVWVRKRWLERSLESGVTTPLAYEETSVLGARLLPGLCELLVGQMPAVGWNWLRQQLIVVGNTIT